VTCSPYALQSPSNGGWGFDEDNEIHSGHVDSELEGSGGHDTLQFASLEAILDIDALLPGHRTVMCLNHLVICEPVQFGSKALSEATAVHEEKR
jgi:hypothetical protein